MKTATTETVLRTSLIKAQPGLELTVQLLRRPDALRIRDYYYIEMYVAENRIVRSHVETMLRKEAIAHFHKCVDDVYEGIGRERP